jgi:hypothetical protein
MRGIWGERGFNVKDEGAILRTPGVDFGKSLEVIYRSGKYLVVRCRGSLGWSGRGMPRTYSPTSYMLLHLRREKVPAKRSLNGKAYTRDYAVQLEEIEPGLEWRGAVLDLVVKCNKMADEKA